MEHLHQLSTKQLLGYLKSARAFGGSFNPFYDSGSAPPGTKWYTIAEIKSVLETREHIPNKIERKKARQEKAKNGKNKN